MEWSNLPLRNKDEWKWQHKFIPLFFFFVGLFSREQKRKFYERYYTTIGGVIYCPGNKDDVKNNPQKYEAILRHELVHIQDNELQPWKFKLTYVFSRKWRAYWEYRGYEQNMRVEYERTGKVSDLTLLAIGEIFKGPMYFWMDRDPMPKLTAIRDKIYRE